jgi:sec-independent protein translocase protein TatA
MELTLPLAFFGLGDQEIILVAVVVLIFFGGKRMPELARGLGKALREFRRATGDVEREFKRMMDETENQTIAPLRDSMKIPPGTLPTTASIFSNETGVVSGAPVATPPPANVPSTPFQAAPPGAASPPPSVPTTPPTFSAPPSIVPPSATHRMQPGHSDDDFHSDI